MLELLFACLPARQDPAALEPAPARLAAAVAEHYVQQAETRYADAFDAAGRLMIAVRELTREPSEERLAAARAAWLEAHEVYSHTEVFRFGNPNVDGWEGRVNGWPMDEGLIDYVGPGYLFHEGNPHALENLIAQSGQPIDDELIAEYSSGADPKTAPRTSITDIESNVATGYHAVEFLLWGQDLAGAASRGGERPATDFATGADCTGGHCERRRQYLLAAVSLLSQDLRRMILDWDPAQPLYARRFGELPLEERLDRMLAGLGGLSFAEVASERILVALLTGDQEEEQSCFSDTTHRALLHNVLAVRTLYQGRHTRLDGSALAGPSLAQLVRALDPALAATLEQQLAASVELARRVAELGDTTTPFDAMVLPDQPVARALLQELMAALGAQTESFEAVRGRLPELVAL